MVAREGNVLKVPGTSGTPEVRGDEILASHVGFSQKGLTLRAGAGVLEAGTLLQVSATPKQYEGVPNTAALGNSIAVLRKGVDATNEAKLANYVAKGSIKLAKLKYADGTPVPAADYAGIATALGGKIDPIHGWLTY